MALSENTPAAISIDDFCRAYGIGRTKVYEEIGAGRLAARKVGSRTIILREDARAWLDSLPVLATHRAGGHQ